MSRDYSSVDVDISASFHDWYDLPALIRANLERYAALETGVRDIAAAFEEAKA